MADMVAVALVSLWARSRGSAASQALRMPAVRCPTPWHGRAAARRSPRCPCTSGAADLEARRRAAARAPWRSAAQAGALAPARVAGVDLAERGQRDGDVLLAHAEARVAHSHDDAAVRAGARLDRRPSRRCGVNFSALQIRLVNTWRSLTPIAADRRQLRHRARPRGRRRPSAPSAGTRTPSALQDLLEIDLARVERALAALDLGDVEDVVDDGQKMAGRVVDEVGIVDGLGVCERRACRARPAAWRSR